jgi:hypothetical protein
MLDRLVGVLDRVEPVRAIHPVAIERDPLARCRLECRRGDRALGVALFVQPALRTPVINAVFGPATDNEALPAMLDLAEQPD